MFIVRTISQFGKVLKVRPTGENKEFWISQTIVIFATVLGVYLAATEGFKLAVKYDTLSAQREAYYLQNSLYNEVLDNVTTAENLIKRIEDNPGQTKHFIDDHEFSLYVWEALPEHGSMFRIPSSVLNDIRTYYFDDENMREDMLSNWAYDASQGVKKFSERTSDMKNKTLPTMKENIDALEDSLIKHGIIQKPVKQKIATTASSQQESKPHSDASPAK